MMLKYYVSSLLCNICCPNLSDMIVKLWLQVAYFKGGKDLVYVVKNR